MTKTEKELLENILKETRYQRRLTLFTGIVILVLTLYLIAYSITAILISCKSTGNLSCYTPYLGVHSIGFATADFIFVAILLIGFVILHKDLSQILKYVWIGITIFAILVLIGSLV